MKRLREYKNISVMCFTKMMIALCASHIARDDLLRREYLMNMLQSVNSQTVPIHLYMSVSGLDDKTILELQDLYAPWLHLISRGDCEYSQLSQFQHYKLLCEELSEIMSPDTWCMFTDDDDVWHERRVEVYLQNMGAIIGTGTMHKDVGAIKGNVQNSDAFISNVVVCTDGRMHNGRMCDEAIEYFEFVTRLHVFHTFFSIATPDILCLRGCDLIWRNVLRSSQGILMFKKPHDVEWLYKQETPLQRMRDFYGYVDETLEAMKKYIVASQNRHAYYNQTQCTSQ